MTDQHQPGHLCLVTTRAPARLVIRSSTPGRTVAYPMLVVDRCPFADPWKGRPHAHLHYLTEPGPPWYRVAPCNRRPYLISLDGAA